MQTITQKSVLTSEQQKEIADQIAIIEKKTSAELRVGIRLERFKKERDIPLAELALNEFHYLGMDKTGMRTGVLFFFLIAEKGYRLLLDETIFQKLDANIVQSVENKMHQCFASNDFFTPLSNSLDILGKVLSQEFPILSNDINELPNEVSIR